MKNICFQHNSGVQNKTVGISNVSYSCFYSSVEESDAQNYYLMSVFWVFFGSMAGAVMVLFSLRVCRMYVFYAISVS